MNAIATSRYALESNSLFISTFIDSANIRETICSSVSRRSSSIDRYSHSTEQSGWLFSSLSWQYSKEYLIGSVTSVSPSLL